MTTSQFDKFGGSRFAFGANKVKELKNVLKGVKDSPLQSESAEPCTAEEIDNLKKELTSVKEKAAKDGEALKKKTDDHLRLMAEFENFRKRMERENDETIKYGIQKLVKDMLPVLDHLEMTLSHAMEKLKADDPFLEGVKMVVRQFTGVLEKYGLQVVTGEGLPFDPHRQEAIGSVETSDFKPGCVMTVHRKGFFLHDRLIRPAVVTVAKAPEAKVQQPPEEKKKLIH